MKEMEAFLKVWEDAPQRTKAAFVRLQEHLAAKRDVSFTFKARPGVSYSLRARHAGQKVRPLFIIMDVIDDDQSSRWLSVCFYPDMITDSEERGILIPFGLLGEDGYCFDLEEWDEKYLCYLEARMDEAYESFLDRGG
ncbi:MAG: hypothetical protein JSU72_07935 [Deltaproteobacteria bacterium]|nr:MAG: hypothetical protein JSU72_07935 [Deltaproteobacteria bacterium]